MSELSKWNWEEAFRTAVPGADITQLIRYSIEPSAKGLHVQAVMYPEADADALEEIRCINTELLAHMAEGMVLEEFPRASGPLDLFEIKSLKLVLFDRSALGGMTVNERLFAAGLLTAFDNAADQRDRDAMVGILKQVDVSDSTADAILADPGKYGV